MKNHSSFFFFRKRVGTAPFACRHSFNGVNRCGDGMGIFIRFTSDSTVLKKSKLLLDKLLTKSLLNKPMSFLIGVFVDNFIVGN